MATRPHIVNLKLDPALVDRLDAAAKAASDELGLVGAVPRTAIMRRAMEIGLAVFERRPGRQRKARK